MTHQEMSFILTHNALCSQSVADTVIMASPLIDDKQRTKATKHIKLVNKQLGKLNREIAEYYRLQSENVKNG